MPNTTRTRPSTPLCRIVVTTDPRTISQARRYAQRALARWNMDEFGDTAILLLSELLTNALKAMAESHPAPPPGSTIRARLRPRGLDALDVSVTDPVPDDGSVKPGTAEDCDELGRGLFLVDALAEAWGVRPTPRGKCVWVRLSGAAA